MIFQLTIAKLKVSALTVSTYELESQIVHLTTFVFLNSAVKAKNHAEAFTRHRTGSGNLL